MSEAFYEDACGISAAPSHARDVAEHALNDEEKIIRLNCFSPRSIKRALEGLQECMRESCRAHRHADDAREMLAKLDAEYEARLDDEEARAW